MSALNWRIQVIFIDDYDDKFSIDEQAECKDSEYRFELAIIKTIQETGIVPIIGDWITPLAKPDYTLDSGAIAGRNFYPNKKTIQFEIA